MFKVVIPARHASTRLPGKPLLDIGGLPMVVRVAQRAAQSGAEALVIATDQERARPAGQCNGAQTTLPPQLETKRQQTKQKKAPTQQKPPRS